MAANDKCTAMRRLQAAAFALQETALFLDTHINDPEAMAYYTKYRGEWQNAKDDYIDRFGPITLHDVKCGDGWKWAQTPWPWEGEM